MDLSKLQKRFPLLKPFSNLYIENYLFNFDNQLFEIPKHAVTRDELELLRIFSGPVTISTTQDIAWYHYLTDQSNVLPAPINDHRLLFLHFDKPFTAFDLLRTTLKALLGKEIILLSLSEHLFVVIEHIKDEEVVDFSYYIDLISADLETNLKVFVSDIIPDITITKTRFSWLVSLQSSLWSYTENHVLTQQELLVPYLSQQLEQQDKSIFCASILKKAALEPDLLYTVKQFIKYEGNSSLAAKKMFMHRNTLQNRLEKFQQLTQKDIRLFEHRLEVFLAITFLETM